jgi:histidinol phosphatase-like enzyme
MLLQAAEDWNIDLTNSIMIGDRETDVQAGINAGVKMSLMIERNKPYELLNTLKQIL